MTQSLINGIWHRSLFWIGFYIGGAFVFSPCFASDVTIELQVSATKIRTNDPLFVAVVAHNRDLAQQAKVGCGLHGVSLVANRVGEREGIRLGAFKMILDEDAAVRPYFSVDAGRSAQVGLYALFARRKKNAPPEQGLTYQFSRTGTYALTVWAAASTVGPSKSPPLRIEVSARGDSQDKLVRDNLDLAYHGIGTTRDMLIGGRIDLAKGKSPLPRIDLLNYRKNLREFVGKLEECDLKHALQWTLALGDLERAQARVERDNAWAEIERLRERTDKVTRQVMEANLMIVLSDRGEHDQALQIINSMDSKSWPWSNYKWNWERADQERQKAAQELKKQQEQKPPPPDKN